jgi:branched-chain amino acid transport system ATP-binding protein
MELGNDGVNMLRVEKLEVFYGKIQALWGVSFEVRDGEIVALVGANGAGKTTTIKTISGLLRPAAGSILLGDQRLDRRAPAAMVELGVIHVPEGRRLFPQMTVLDNLLLGGYAPAARSQRPQRLNDVFDVFPMLRDRQGQLAGTLSGGEQQMVAIGRGLMAGPKILMLDEPSLGLAPIMVEEMFRVIREINQRGVTVLLVEQNTENALELAHRGYVLESGRVVLEGSGRELLANTRVREAYLGL